MSACLRARFLLPAAAAAVAAGVLAVEVGPAGAQGGECQGWIPPNTLVLAAGSPQQGQVGKQFQTGLQVALANTNACPLSGSWAGVPVTFTAPASGPGGTFASTHSAVAVVGTDANGTAVAPPFSADGEAGSYAVVAGSAYGSVTFFLTNTAAGVVASIVPAGPAVESATVGRRFPQPLRAQVRDADGNPVAGVSVAFALGTGAGGAGASFASGGAQATAVTDASGVATSPLLTADGTPGRFTATASTDGVAAPATYALRSLAPRLLAAGGARTATVEARYRLSLRALVLDVHRRPVAGMTVTFALPQPAGGGAGATFVGGGTQATATTNARGVASSPPLIANSGAGGFTATASIAAVPKPVTYSLRNLAGALATVAAGAASGESTPTGTRFPIPLAVTVTDKDGNPVAGVMVTFTAPARGPSGRFGHGRSARVRTDRHGVAVAPPFTASSAAGGYVVTARAGGEQSAFALVNTAR